MSNVSSRRWPTGKEFLAYCTGIALLIGAVAVMMRGGIVKGPSDIEFQVNDPRSPLAPTLEIRKVDRQELEEKREEVVSDYHEADEQVHGPAVPTPGEVETLAGTWRDVNTGFRYVIEQNGAFVSFAEYNPVYGMTAAGQGTVSGDHASLVVQTLVGAVDVRLSREKHQLRMTVNGMTFQLVMA